MPQKKPVFQVEGGEEFEESIDSSQDTPDPMINHFHYLEVVTGESAYPNGFMELATIAQKIALDNFVKSSAILEFRLQQEMLGHPTEYDKSLRAYTGAAKVLCDVTGLDQYADLNAALQKVIAAGYDATKRA